MPGTLFVVATPIGNLEDLTFRAARVLAEVPLIAAEDTRRTATLLRHYQIKTRTTSFHDHNEKAKLPILLAHLRAGTHMALVSDAGTPGIADPGSRLIRACITEGIPVTPIPGASAAIAGLVVSGLPTHTFTFAGFIPSRSNDRFVFLTALVGRAETLVFFESALRLKTTLAEMLTYFGDRPICLGRELTKHFEELVRGPISGVLRQMPTLKGEFVIVVSGNDSQITSLSDEALAAEYGRLTKRGGLSRRGALRVIARSYSISTNELYERLEGLSGHST